MSRYGVKEVFRSVYDGGALAGRSVVQVRFSGCNLWSGMPHQREEGSALCALWCDTDFTKGIVLGVDDLLGMMQEQWPVEPGSIKRWCVLTGGEPTLQIDKLLVAALHDQGWKVAVETNGTVECDALEHCDHVCYSPKLCAPDYALGYFCPHEVKVVLPGAPPMTKGWSDEQLKELEELVPKMASCALYVQPQDPVLPGDERASWLHGGFDEDEAEVLRSVYDNAVKRCVKWVHANPRWRLSLQTHKLIGLP